MQREKEVAAALEQLTAANLRGTTGECVTTWFKDMYA